MALTREQRRNAKILLDEATRLGASPREKKALIEAALVESNLRNVDYGDRDSLGLLQQRPSQGWGTPDQVMNPRYAARQFITRAKKANQGKGSAGTLAQSVQRSAFPDRYDKVGMKAEEILQDLDGKSESASVTGLPFDPGQPVDADLSGLLKRRDPQPVKVLDAPISGRDKLKLAGSVPVSNAQPQAQRASIEDVLAQIPEGHGLPSQGTSSQPNKVGRTPKGDNPRQEIQAISRSVQKAANVKVSGKRDPHENAAVGGAEDSDHLTTNRDSDARDFSGSLEDQRAAAQVIARELGIKGFKWGRDYTVKRGKVRWQLITSLHGTGQHVHLGARRV